MAKDLHMRCVEALMSRYSNIKKTNGYHNDVRIVTWGKILVHDNRPMIVNEPTNEEDYPLVSVDEQDVSYPEGFDKYPNKLATLNLTASIALYGIADEFKAIHEARMDLFRATDFSTPLVEDRIFQRQKFEPRVTLITPREDGVISMITLQMSITFATIQGVEYELAKDWWNL